MKSLIVSVIILLLMMPSVSKAQSAEPSLALKGGPDIATQAANFRVNRYGFSGGVAGALQWPLVNPFLLSGQIELLYTQRGAEVVVDGSNIGQIREHYVDLTLSVKPEASFGLMSAYLLLGGGLNYLVSAKRDDATGSGQDITDGTHRIDLTLLGAVGLALHLPHRNPGSLHLGTVFLEARHEIGLLDVALDGGFKNRTSSLMLGFSFVIGGSPPAGQNLAWSSRRSNPR